MVLEALLDAGSVAKWATSSSTAQMPSRLYKAIIIIIIIGIKVPEITAEEAIKDETMTPITAAIIISFAGITTSKATTITITNPRQITTNS